MYYNITNSFRISHNPINNRIWDPFWLRDCGILVINGLVARHELFRNSWPDMFKPFRSHFQPHQCIGRRTRWKTPLSLNTHELIYRFIWISVLVLIIDSWTNKILSIATQLFQIITFIKMKKRIKKNTKFHFTFNNGYFYHGTWKNVSKMIFLIYTNFFNINITKNLLYLHVN